MGMHARMSVAVAAVAAVLNLAPAAAAAAAPPAGGIRDFGPNLEALCANPEGIARDPEGHVYAASFAPGRSASICVLDRRGRVLREITVPAGRSGVAALLGELFTPGQGLYVADFADGVLGDGRLLRIDPGTGAIEVLATGFAAANAIAQDEHGDLFVSDSFAGTITRVARDGSSSAI